MFAIWGVTGPLRSILATGTIAWVRLGDGTTRVCAGERVRCRNDDGNSSIDMSPGILRWREWPNGVLGGGLVEGENRYPLPMFMYSFDRVQYVAWPT